MNEVFDIYAAALPRVRTWAEGQFARADGESEAAHSRACQAKALDLLRGLLPAASLSHMGIFATGQTYEQLVLHLLAHPLPEARHYGRMILDTLQAVMPSFVSRVERPDRGGEWIAFLEEREAAGRRWAARLGLDREPGEEPEGGPSVRLLHVDGDEDALLAALLFESAGAPEEVTRTRLAALSGDERRELLTRPHGRRAAQPPPPSRPGPGGPALPLRDRQRLRRLPRPAAPPHAHRAVAAAGAAPGRRRPGRAGGRRASPASTGARWTSRTPNGTAWPPSGREGEALYALCLGYRIRFVLDLNAREAMQLIELRSGREGHPSYRAVAHEMHRQIEQVHPAVAGAMTLRRP